jgi:hypothetical protein
MVVRRSFSEGRKPDTTSKESVMKRQRILWLVFTSIVCASIERVSAQAPATPLPAGVQRVTSVEGITEYTLANGLRVLVFPGSVEGDDHRECHVSGRVEA